ncbi:MAG: hypothetical protein HUK02_08595 [Bacteroidaceae bacterium]|nr:hypothetical protein [Bacteroidaceae bacterium]
MKNYTISFAEQGVTAEVTAFCPEQGGVTEWHVILHVEPRGELFAGQMARLYEVEDQLTSLPQLHGAHYILKRYFLSDSANQQPLMRTDDPCVAVSCIQQQPLDGSKMAAWFYLQSETAVTCQHGMVAVEHNGYRHLWKMGLTDANGDSAAQTESVLKEYESRLARFGATLAENCVRTWFFVRDVDTQYAGMVKARKENFVEQGLTEQTHYIASTGIGGLPGDTQALIQLGAYALQGFDPEQQRYLYAPTHLNPTYEYGVTFERGVALDFGDRRHVYISGTASIDNKGQVLHVGDIVKQTHRMWENVETLLAEADATFDDVMQIIVYLRDTADYLTVRHLFDERFPHIPYVITLAPVCRPAWLVEMECMAISPLEGNAFKPF